ncbi:MAG: hypothetical protein IJ147_03945 [Lachnospiraceae bacterium]|nr:hypothetical protein [Lachnospiraceae bacterium]
MGGLICGAVSMVMAIVAIVIALIIAENPSDMASDPESIKIEEKTNTGNKSSDNSSDELTFGVDANTVEGGELENAPGDGMDNPSDGQGTDVFGGYEGNYVIAAQSNISGTVEQIYSQAFGDGYYIQLSGTNEFGEQMAISGIATESAAISDSGSSVYYMWEESCDNLQFMVTFYDSDYMDIQCIDSAVMDDREEHLGQTFSSTYFRQ